MSRAHDAPGTRRASREFGPNARGYRRQRPTGESEGMWRKFGRRASNAGRFGWRHRKRVFGLVAAVAVAYVAIYFAYVGTVTIVQVLVCVGALVGAGALAHHENMKLRRSLADQPKPSFSQQKQWARGQGEPHRRPEPTPDTIRVRSHRNDGHGVDAHTRRRPGAPQKPRTWDGSPETAADTRFFDLRESGWRGPIDQDGYKVTNEDAWRHGEAS